MTRFVGSAGLRRVVSTHAADCTGEVFCTWLPEYFAVALTLCVLGAVQYYFETLFPRVPKPVQDDMVAKLAARGLPTKAIGNAGQGGADRRGVDEPNRRPASVKVRRSQIPIMCNCCHIPAFM